MTFERGFCPTCGVIDGKVVKSPPMLPPVPGWGEVGPNFDRCISGKGRQILPNTLASDNLW